MNIKDIIKLKFGSSLLRAVLKRFYKEGYYYTVLFGKLKGLKSYYRKDINFHTMAGLWETDSISVLDKMIRTFQLNKKDILVADVGANLGYYSMYFGKNLSSDSNIYSFEPSTSILDVLKKNIEKNKFHNVEIIEAACSEKTGTVDFYIGENHHSSSILDSWAGNSVSGTLTTVKAVCLDEFFEEKTPGKYPDIIKMDIEGAGVYALKGCDRCLSSGRPFVLIESHTPEEDMAVSRVLIKYGYDGFRVGDGKWITHKENDYRDPDGVWGTMMLIPTEKKHLYKN